MTRAYRVTPLIREWRIVDSANAPFDTGEDGWPIYENEKTAREMLDLYLNDHADEGLHLQTRTVNPWRDADG